MWVLCDNERDGTRQFRLLCNRPLVVGRHTVIALGDTDKSISRNHAVLQITFTAQSTTAPAAQSTQAAATPSAVPCGTVTLTDTSKYGTFVNGERLTGAQARSVATGDRLRFGLQWNTWSLQWRDTAVMTSQVTHRELRGQLLRSVLDDLGARASGAGDWCDQPLCLLMSKFRLSVKAAQTLAAATVPLVTLSYLVALRDRLATDAAAGDPLAGDHLPPADEPVVRALSRSCLLPDPRRCQLLAGRRLVFAGGRHQMSRLQRTVQLAGGQTQLLADTPLEQLCADGVLVVAADHTSAQPAPEHVVKFLSAAKRRLIGEHEIGLALLRVSVVSECNPLAAASAETVAVQDSSNRTGDEGVGGGISSDAIFSGRSQAGPALGALLAPDTELAAHEDSRVGDRSRRSDEFVSSTPDTVNRNRLSSVDSCNHFETPLPGRFDELSAKETAPSTITQDKVVGVDTVRTKRPLDTSCEPPQSGVVSGDEPRHKILAVDSQSLDVDLPAALPSSVQSLRVRGQIESAGSYSHSHCQSVTKVASLSSAPDATRSESSSTQANVDITIQDEESRRSSPINSVIRNTDHDIMNTECVNNSEKLTQKRKESSAQDRNFELESNTIQESEYDRHSVSSREKSISEVASASLPRPLPSASVRIAPKEDAGGWLSKVSRVKQEPLSNPQRNHSDSSVNNSTTIIVADLLHRPLSNITMNSPRDSTASTDQSEPNIAFPVNFKRFRSKSARPIVQIIGGSDMYVHCRALEAAAAARNENDDDSSAAHRDELDGFEEVWNPVRASKRRR